MRATATRLIGIRVLVLGLVLGVIVLGAGGCKPAMEAETSIQGFTRVSDYLWILDESGLAKRLTAEAAPGREPTGQVASTQESVDADPGCTCIYAAGNDQPVFGRNFDWTTSPALLTFNHPANGYSSISVYCMTGNSAGIPIGPVKKLTEEQRTKLARLARGGVFDGMNDQGLVIGMNAITDSRYYSNRDPSLPDIGELGVMRKALNEAATVDQALDIFKSHNVIFESPSPEMEPVKVHYLLADAHGDSAIVEYVDGKIVIMRGNGKWQITTNFRIYEATAAALTGCPRYTKAQETVAGYDGALTEDAMMEVLKSVSQSWRGGGTQWSVVYDLKARQVEIVVNRDYDILYRYGFAGNR